MTDRSASTSRRSARFAIAVPGRVKLFGTAKPEKVTVSDLSSVGCQLAPADGLRTGGQVLVKIPGLSYWPATVVWKRQDTVGVEFKNPLHPLAVEEFARQLVELNKPAGDQSA
jgi:hypothetical protein